MNHDSYAIEHLATTPLNHGYAGWYVLDRNQTDTTLDNVTWTDRGNGPEPNTQGVHGPFAAKQDAHKFAGSY